MAQIQESFCLSTEYWTLNTGSLREPGGGERDRTDDLLRARQALSQLSYTPMVLRSRTVFSIQCSVFRNFLILNDHGSISKIFFSEY
jgi:hypothetical protein